MDPIRLFSSEKKKNIKRLGADKRLKDLSVKFIVDSARYKYSYNFDWLGRPIIQLPQDIVAMQEIIWSVKPDLIIETGIAHGGSLIFSASILALLEMCKMVKKAKVLGIDIDIREHNRIRIEEHPLAGKIKMIRGSSVAENTIRQVRNFAKGYRNILVILDSNHTHEHVLAELNTYASLVSKGSYMVVFDTMIERMPKGFFKERLWDKGNNPDTAVREFLKTDGRFRVDRGIENKLLITVAPNGYLKRIR